MDQLHQELPQLLRCIKKRLNPVKEPTAPFTVSQYLVSDFFTGEGGGNSNKTAKADVSAHRSNSPSVTV